MPEIVTVIAAVYSELLMNAGPLLGAVIFWCISKEAGSKVLFALCTGDLATNTVKLTACVYRPWIRDSRLHVAEAAREGATGYSFPSGHTTGATATFGMTAIWKRDRRKLAAVLVGLIFLAGFARNFLGAHTAADVITALAVGAVSIGFVCFWYGKLGSDGAGEVAVLIGYLVCAALVLIYVSLRSYPMDLGADGMLLADPNVMRADAFSSAGMLTGWVVGWFIERRWIRFRVEGSTKEKVLRAIFGVLLFGLLYKVIMKKAVARLALGLGAFIRRFVSFFFLSCLYPGLIGISQKRRNVQ